MFLIPRAGLVILFGYATSGAGEQNERGSLLRFLRLSAIFRA